MRHHHDHHHRRHDHACDGRRHMRGEGHGPRDGRHRGGRGGPMRPERIFGQGELRLVLLQLVGERPRHGYELIKAIEELTGGAYAPSPGVIYPTLTMLEELGQVTIEAEEGGRKRYALTEAGRAELAAQQPAVTAMLARIAERTPAGGPPLPLIRAMENLRLALRLRLSRGAPTSEQVEAMAEAIDAAARAVERS